MAYIKFVFHYNGRLVIENNYYDYVGNNISVVSRTLEKDTLSMIELYELMEKIKVFNIGRFWYLKPGLTLSRGLRSLFFDEDVLEMVNMLGEDKTLHIYVEHNPNEPLMDVGKPISSYKVLYLEWDPNPSLGTSEHNLSIVKDRYVVEGFESPPPQPTKQDILSTNEDRNEGFEPLPSQPTEQTIPATNEDINEGDRYKSVEYDENETTSHSSDGPITEDVDSTYASSNELNSPLVSDLDVEVPRHFRPNVDMEAISFKVGMKFSTKDELKEALKEYAIRGSYNVKLVKNDKVRLRAVCVGDCPWKIHASVMQGEPTFQIKTYMADHSCHREIHNINVSSSWVAKKYLDRFRVNPNLGLTEVQEAVKADFKVNISKSQAYRAKRKATRKLSNSFIEQYRRLGEYKEELLQSNEGSTVNIQCDRVVEGTEPIFTRFYICFKGCKDGFKFCRPFICLDAWNLKGPSQGQLMAAVGVDGNDCIFPIAWAVVEAKTKDSWTWFLRLLENDVGSFEERGITFMSDQQKGLFSAFNDFFPNANHRFCVRHLYANFRRYSYKKDCLKNYFWNAVRSNTLSEFEGYMDEIAKVDINAYQYLNDIPLKYWSKHAFDIEPKCDMVMNNLSECFKSFISKARDKPIIEMLEIIRKMIMARMAKKHDLYSHLEGEMGNKIENKLEKWKSMSRNCTPTRLSDMLFEVEVHNSQLVVDVENRKCSCRQWELSGIPCPHAVQCILYLERRLEDFVHPYYLKDTLLKTYSSFPRPVNGPNLWPKTSDVPIQPPPIIRRPPGRPRRLRRDEDEASSTNHKLRRSSVHCGKCKRVGHNSRSCKGFNVPTTDVEASQIHESEDTATASQLDRSTPSAFDVHTQQTQNALAEGEDGVQVPQKQNRSKRKRVSK